MAPCLQFCDLDHKNLAQSGRRLTTAIRRKLDHAESPSASAQRTHHFPERHARCLTRRTFEPPCRRRYRPRAMHRRWSSTSIPDSRIAFDRSLKSATDTSSSRSISGAPRACVPRPRGRRRHSRRGSRQHTSSGRRLREHFTGDHHPVRSRNRQANRVRLGVTETRHGETSHGRDRTARRDFCDCAGPGTRTNQLSAAEKADGWQLLFDGRTLAGWHGLGFKDTPPGLWVVDDGAIKHAAKGAGPLQPDGQPLTGMDLISDRAFQNFELAWEWKIAEAGNSGLKYNVSEELSTKMSPPHAAKGWEYQMNDDEKNEDNKLATHRSGALYDMLPAEREEEGQSGGPVEPLANRLSRQSRRALAERREDRGVRSRNGDVRFGVRQEQVQQVPRVVRHAPRGTDRAPGPRRRRLVSRHQDSRTQIAQSNTHS